MGLKPTYHPVETYKLAVDSAKATMIDHSRAMEPYAHLLDDDQTIGEYTNAELKSPTYRTMREAQERLSRMEDRLISWGREQVAHKDPRLSEHTRELALMAFDLMRDGVNSKSQAALIKLIMSYRDTP